MADNSEKWVEDLKKANSLFDDFSNKLSRAIRLNIEFKGIDEASKATANLERNLSNVSKVNKELSDNWRKLAQAQKEISKQIDDNSKKIEENISKQDKNQKSIKDLQRIRSEEKEKMKELGKEINDLDTASKTYYNDLQKLEKQFDESQKKVENSIEGIRKLSSENDDLTETNTGLLISNIKLKKAAQELDTPFQVLIKTLGKQLWDAVGKLTDGILSMATALLALPFTALFDGLKKYWDYLSKVIAINSQFNQSIGPTTEGLDQMRQKAWEVDGTLQGLGEEMGAGVMLYAETAHGVGFVGGEFDKLTKNAALAGRALGIGGAAAGELTHTFIQLGTSTKDAQHDLVEISRAANVAGVPVADFGKEIVSAKNVLASFGNTGKKVFLQAAAYAKRLGVSIQSLTKFMDMTDTFDKTAESAAKLNTVFGTNINALDLMLEQDPSKRMESIRSAMAAQGKSFESLSRQERKFFAESVGMSEEEAAGFLNSKMTLEKFQKEQAKAKQKEKSDEATIRDGLAKTAKTLLNLEAIFRSVLKAASPLFDTLLEAAGIGKGFRKIGENVKELQSGIEKFFTKLKDNPKVLKFLNTFGGVFKSIFGAVKAAANSDELIDNLVESAGNFAEKLEEIVVFAKKFVDEYFTKENLQKVADIVSQIIQSLPEIIAGFAFLKTLIGGYTVISGIGTIVSMFGGAGGLASAFSALSAAITSPAGLVVAVGLAAVALGTLINKIPYVSDSIQWYMDIHKEAGDYMRTRIMSLFGDKNQQLKDAGFAGGVDQAKMLGEQLKQFKSGNGEIGNVQLVKKNAELLSKVIGMSSAEIEKLADEQIAKNKTSREKQESVTPTSPAVVAQAIPTITKPASSQTLGTTPADYSKTKVVQKTEKGEITLIAGDVYLDGNLVGRTMIRNVATP